MTRKRQKSPLQHFLDSKIMTALLLVAVVLLSRSVWDRYVIERDMAERRASAESELQELQERHTSLQEEVEYLSHERGIEAEMRRQFDVARPGEQVVVIVDDEREEGEVAGIATSTSSQPAPWYQFWR